MKRPEGFDPPANRPAPGREAKQPKPARAPKQPKQPRAEKSARPAKPEKAPAPAATVRPERPTARPEQPRTTPPERTAAPEHPRIPHPSQPVRPDAGSRGDLRRAARERRRAERAEVRRFTRRSRNRRIAIAVVGGVIAALVGLVFTAVFSPILALREVRVDGTSRVSAEEVAAAVGGQLGTPLALLDFGRIEEELGAFPLIRSYVTETLPPDTLVIHVVERQPVGSIAAPGGGFHLIDPAGIVLQESAERIPGVPLIDLAGADASTPAFAAAVEVLLALPPELLAQVDTVTAHTQDDVALVLAGVGQRVTWGSAEESAKKAVLLARLIGVTDPAQAGEFDVSAPSNGVFRPAS